MNERGGQSDKRQDRCDQYLSSQLLTPRSDIAEKRSQLVLQMRLWKS